jgi:F-box protein 21
MTGRLDLLPDEILHSVLRSSDPLDAVALGRVSRKFKAVTTHPVLWRQYCREHFRHWDERHDIEQKLNAPASSIDWKALYAERHVLDVRTTRTLNEIISHQSGSIRRIESIVTRGHDITDTLLRHIAVGNDAEDYLARRWVIL